MSSGKQLLPVFLAAAVFVCLTANGDFRNVGHRIDSFPFSYLSADIALAVLNFLLRFLSWSYYLKILIIDVPLKLSFLVFFSGLALSITHGQVGELVKAYFSNSRAGFRMASTIPAVLMERLTDVVAVVLLGLVGLALLPESILRILVGVLALNGLLVWFLAPKTQRTPVATAGIAHLEG